MALLRWFGRRGRVDRMRRNLDPHANPSSSATLTEAVDRLEWTLQRHLADERAVRATEDRLIRALDVIPQGVVLADGDGRVVFHNEPASGFFAARHAEALVEAAIAELIGDAVQGESVTRTLDLYGPPRRGLFLRAVPLYTEPGDGHDEVEIEGAFLVVEDISERQRLDAVRRDFVANISHELKTPIGAIGLLSEALHTAADDPESVRMFAERLGAESSRIARLTQDIIELSRLQAVDAIANAERVEIDHILAAAIDQNRVEADAHAIELMAGAPTGAVVYGDEKLLVTAVDNLISNAIRYSPDGSRIGVGSRIADGVVEIAVTDQGEGIPEADQDRIFERFFRVDQARSRTTGGTGLGLSIVKHAVQNHGGDVRVWSQPGMGSTFTIRLPEANQSTTAIAELGTQNPARPQGEQNL